MKGGFRWWKGGREVGIRLGDGVGVEARITGLGKMPEGEPRIGGTSSARRRSKTCLGLVGGLECVTVRFRYGVSSEMFVVYVMCTFGPV